MTTPTPSRRTVLAGISRTLRAQLKDRRRHGLPTADLERLLGDGELFVGASTLRADAAVWAWFRRRRARPKRCFEYAQRFVLHDEAGAATYHEGYVLTPGMPPVHHAWLVAGGRVFDPTLEAADEELGRDDARDHQCFGVPFNRQVVNASVLRNGASVPLLPSL